MLGDFTELLVGHPAESENTNYQNTLILMLYTSLATLPYGLEQGASVDTYALTRLCPPVPGPQCSKPALPQTSAYVIGCPGWTPREKQQHRNERTMSIQQ